MLMVAAAVFFADVAAVIAIVASIWAERSLGLTRGLIIDLVFVIAISYGVGAWAMGKWGRWELAPRKPTARSSHHHHVEGAGLRT
jgi:hypothetical protein